jgi:hypothetical protein
VIRLSGSATACSLALSVACTPASRREVNSFGELRPGEVVLVGRVELVPPLQPGEQDESVAKSPEYGNKAWLFLDPQGRPWDGEVSSADFDHSIGARFGEAFMVAVEGKPQFVSGGMVVLRRSLGFEIARLPPGLWIDVQADDRAVYAGTIRFVRNEFFEVHGAEVADEQETEQPAYEAKFGTDVPLRKSLAHPR